MAGMFLSIHRLPGDADDLLARKRAHMDPVTSRIAPAYGAIFSVTVKTDEGLLTVNLWESREGAAALTRDPDVQRAQRESGLPMPASFEGYEDAQYIAYRPAAFASDR